MQLTSHVNVYIVFMDVYHTFVYLSISASMGLFICNIAEHVKYVSEIRSFLVGLILFSLSSFYHYELKLCGSKLPVTHWQWQAHQNCSE